jgi:hypothetical protein
MWIKLSPVADCAPATNTSAFYPSRPSCDFPVCDFFAAIETKFRTNTP